MVCSVCGYDNIEGTYKCQSCGAAFEPARGRQPQAAVTIDIESVAKKSDADEKLRETRKLIAVMIGLGAIILIGLLVLSVSTF